MSGQDGIQGPALQRPTTNDREAWKAYWKAQSQPWRTEPEIDLKRQEDLAKRSLIMPNIEQGIYPFKDIEPKLTRADVEWLLATHENGRGPVDWSDESQRERQGLDVRGADLQEVDLHNLPLARLLCGLSQEEKGDATVRQRKIAGAMMNEVNFREAQLEGASFVWARLEEASFVRARLERASFAEAQLKEANLYQAQLKGADLFKARLEKASFVWAQLEETNLYGAELERTDLANIKLSGENSVGPHVTDVQWNSTNLAVVDWSQIKKLGDEHFAKQNKQSNGLKKDKDTRLTEYRDAVRANRLLAVALQTQGLNDVATHFAYRAQILQRIVLRRQRKLGQYLLSLFLDLLAGYGYKLWRSFLAYLLVIGIFAALYYYLSAHLNLNEAIVISMTTFHGRGFFPNQFKPGDPEALVAAIEAFVGLFIEVTFIATLTQRLFGK
jgi:uncharacterized protein YjbI with pentapeptide repeats